MSNDVSPREHLWQRFGDDGWDSFDALPERVRQRLQQHAYDAWSGNALLLWRILRRRHASSARAELLLLRHIDHCETLERAAFAAGWRRENGTELPHLAAAASVLRGDAAGGIAQDGMPACRTGERWAASRGGMGRRGPRTTEPDATPCH